MLVKFFGNKGGGSATASMNYLLGKDRLRKDAEVLSGNPELSVALAEGLDFKNKYTVGCLSFEENDIKETDKKEIMALFEKTLFAGLKAEQYNITWIQHTDKNRLELNFFIPNVELNTQKRLQPYYDKADRWIVDAFKHVVNHNYKLSDPNDPEKAQLLSKSYYESKDRRELKEVITERLENKIAQGLIKDRKGIETAMKEMGLTISRTTQKSISIQNPDGGQNIRFKGVIYEQNFRFNAETQERIRERASKYQSRSEERYQVFYGQLERGISERQKTHAEKYPQSKFNINRDWDINSHRHGIWNSDLVAEQQTCRGKRNLQQTTISTEVPENKQPYSNSRQTWQTYDSRAFKQSRILEEQRQSRHQAKLKILLEKSHELLKRIRTNINRITEKFGYSTHREQRTERTKQTIRDGLQQIDGNQQRVRNSQSVTRDADKIIDKNQSQLKYNHQNGMKL